MLDRKEMLVIKLLHIFCRAISRVTEFVFSTLDLYGLTIRFPWDIYVSFFHSICVLRDDAASDCEKSPKPDDSVNTGDKSSESLGNQRAPQRITNPQEWPHIFAPGEPKLFNELSMAEFSAGYTVIIQRCTDVSRRATLISHFHDLVVLASTMASLVASTCRAVAVMFSRLGSGRSRLSATPSRCFPLLSVSFYCSTK